MSTLDELLHLHLVDLLFALLQSTLFWLVNRTYLIKWTICFAFLMALLCLMDLCSGASWQPFITHWLFFPMAVQTTWHLMVGPIWVVILTPIVIAYSIRAYRSRSVLLAAPSPTSSPDNRAEQPTRLAFSRRQFLLASTAVAAPLSAVAMGVYCEGINEDLRVRRFVIQVDKLPAEMEGFTIAHVSDLHSGRFCGPERLKVMTDLVNDLKADLIAVTGDLINEYIFELPNSLTALSRLRAPFGMYLCEGNHDLNPGAGLVYNACVQRGIPYLKSSYEVLNIHGKRLVLGGVPWVMEEKLRHFDRNPETERLIASAFPEKVEGDIRVLLAHHPHFFESATDIDLVLSGHTHGGQIMIGDVGIGSAAFRYWSGQYSRDKSTLVVSNGCGDWFPCRIGAPAEVGLLTLKRRA